MILNDITNITNQIENIDGEEVYVLDKSMRLGIDRLKEKVAVAKDDHFFSMLKKDIEFICEKENFAIAFRPVNFRITKWLPCLIYKYQGNWRRVQLEYANCLKCNWRGNIANPTNPELFFTLKNEFELMHNMSKLPFCKCPKCGGEISRKAIWTEDGEE